MNLTDHKIQAYQQSRPKNVTKYDNCNNLRITITRSVTTFLYQWEEFVEGKRTKRTIKIGKYPAVSLSAARAIAKSLREYHNQYGSENLFRYARVKLGLEFPKAKKHDYPTNHQKEVVAKRIENIKKFMDYGEIEDILNQVYLGAKEKTLPGKDRYFTAKLIERLNFIEMKLQENRYYSAEIYTLAKGDLYCFTAAIIKYLTDNWIKNLRYLGNLLQKL